MVDQIEKDISRNLLYAGTLGVEFHTATATLAAALPEGSELKENQLLFESVRRAIESVSSTAVYRTPRESIAVLDAPFESAEEVAYVEPLKRRPVRVKQQKAKPNLNRKAKRIPADSLKTLKSVPAIKSQSGKRSKAPQNAKQKKVPTANNKAAKKMSKAKKLPAANGIVTDAQKVKKSTTKKIAKPANFPKKKPKTKEPTTKQINSKPETPAIPIHPTPKKTTKLQTENKLKPTPKKNAKTNKSNVKHKPNKSIIKHKPNKSTIHTDNSTSQTELNTDKVKKKTTKTKAPNKNEPEKNNTPKNTKRTTAKTPTKIKKK